LFKWIDVDSDNLISYNDFKETIGKYIAPTDSHYFRQEFELLKNKPC